MNFLTHMEKDRDDIKYLQIVYNNINQLIELIESYGDTIKSIRDLYMVNVSLQMNDTMRILTIFLPLTLIVGIYGMNGIDMTKINDIPQGFFIVVIIMIIITLISLWFFKKKQWISYSNEDDHNKSIKE
jgi:magnesium transporter